MTREEAERRCVELAAIHPNRDRAQWRPQKRPDGTWAIVMIGLPPAQGTTPEQQADERPPTADDPRAPIFQNIPPYGAGF